MCACVCLQGHTHTHFEFIWSSCRLRQSCIVAIGVANNIGVVKRLSRGPKTNYCVHNNIYTMNINRVDGAVSVEIYTKFDFVRGELQQHNNQTENNTNLLCINCIVCVHNIHSA